MKIPRVMIAGTHSGVGKTTITTAVIAALAGEGYNVQPYKVGPDYIDPSYHSIASGNPCRNLDAWMLPESTLYGLFTRSASKADLAVIEGVMGVFDGSSGSGEHGSSAHIAKIVKCPVILIVDVKSMARSAAALVLGFQNFDPELNIAGVILNRIGSDRHLGLVTEAIEKYCNIPVVGYIRKNAKLELPSRHLGLVPASEGGSLPDRIRALAGEIKEGIDLQKIVRIARSADDMPLHQEAGTSAGEPAQKETAHEEPAQGEPAQVRIGLARDEAFSFYYQDALEALESQGAEIVPFSPLHDCRLPEGLDGLYIGGGFPEMFLAKLAENTGLLQEIRSLGLAGMPILAECGGLMYLARTIVDFEQREYPMAGLVPGRCLMEKKLVGMGYVEAECLQDNILSPAGGKIKGHEFHYSRLVPDNEEEFNYAFRLVRNRCRETVLDGYNGGNVLASYLHLHLAADPELAASFVAGCRKYRNLRDKGEHK